MKLLFTLLLGLSSITQAATPGHLYLGCGYLKNAAGERVVIEDKRFDVDCKISAGSIQECDLLVMKLTGGYLLTKIPMHILGSQDNTTFLGDDQEYAKASINNEDFSSQLTIANSTAKCRPWNN